MAGPIRIRGIRQALPPNTLIGRLQGGGQAQTINLTQLRAQVIKAGASGGGGGGGSTTLAALTDVALSSPSDGQVLTYVLSAGKWENKAIPTATGFVKLQGTTPGTADTGNFNISGSGIIGDQLTLVNPPNTSLYRIASLGILTNGATMDLVSVGGNPAAVRAQAANGTISAPTAITSGMVIGRYAWRGYDGATLFNNLNTAQMDVTATENFTTSAHGGRLSFFTTANGTTTTTSRMTIDNTGFVAIGSSTTPRASLDIGGQTDAVALPSGSTAQRPSSPVDGMIRYNSDNNGFDVYVGGQWQQLVASSPGGLNHYASPYSSSTWTTSTALFATKGLMFAPGINMTLDQVFLPIGAPNATASHTFLLSLLDLSINSGGTNYIINSVTSLATVTQSMVVNTVQDITFDLSSSPVLLTGGHIYAICITDTSLATGTTAISMQTSGGGVSPLGAGGAIPSFAIRQPGVSTISTFSSSPGVELPTNALPTTSTAITIPAIGSVYWMRLRVQW